MENKTVDKRRLEMLHALRVSALLFLGFLFITQQVLINVENVDKSKLGSSKALASAIGEFESKLGATGRILLRASGTEPLVRVMVEAETESAAEEIAMKLAAQVRLELA